MQNTEQSSSRLRRIGWFFAIWAMSVLGLAVVSYTLKAIFSL